MLLEASSVLGKGSDEVRTHVADENEHMETDSVLHDDTSTDVLSICEKFYLKHKWSGLNSFLINKIY